MRHIWAAALSFLFCAVAQAETDPLCVIDPADMPASWHPSDEFRQTLKPEPWSEREAKDAVSAIETGLSQIIGYYEKRPNVVFDLWDDAVSSVIEVSYSGSNMPEIQAVSRNTARKVLTRLIGRYLNRNPHRATCDDYDDTLPLTIFTNSLFAKDDPRVAKMAAFTNAAYRQCGSLKAAMETDYAARLSKSPPVTEEIFDLVIWSTWLIESELVPDLERPKGARAFSKTLWRYLETYPLNDASTYESKAGNRTFRQLGYLATHIAFIPTGYQRHPIYIADQPKLYGFLRRNFYPLMEAGEADLLAEVIDTLRQYGCTETNDRQVRDGARYMLNLFHTYDDDWMAYPEPGLSADDVTDYDLIHKAWTGIASVRVRVPEPADPGTYGGVVREWLLPRR
jgi:hypothetical protein